MAATLQAWWAAQCPTVDTLDTADLAPAAVAICPEDAVIRHLLGRLIAAATTAVAYDAVTEASRSYTLPHGWQWAARVLQGEDPGPAPSEDALQRRAMDAADNDRRMEGEENGSTYRWRMAIDASQAAIDAADAHTSRPPKWQVLACVGAELPPAMLAPLRAWMACDFARDAYPRDWVAAQIKRLR